MPPSPTVDDLSSREPLLVISHEGDLGAQLRPFLYALGAIPTIYWLSNLTVLVFVVRLAFRQGPILLGLSYACAGMTLGYALLLPLHEWLHALAYRLLGFSRVSVVYRWRTLTAFCVADKAVLASKQFWFVCLAPSIPINAILVLAIGFTAGVPQLLLSGALLLHLAAASGDVALLNVLWLHRRTPLFTYDDVEAKTSRFVLWPDGA